MDEKFFVNKDYEAYNIYLSIRAHFHGRTGKGFDIKNSNYTANMPFAKYQAKSAIVIMFKKLTEKFQRQEVIDIIVSNFANGDKFGGQPFDSNAIKKRSIPAANPIPAVGFPPKVLTKLSYLPPPRIAS